MSYFNDHTKTEAELHTIGALLCVLEEAGFNYLTKDNNPIASGVLNTIQVIAERVTKAQELHDAEYSAQVAPETPIAAMHREIVRRHAVLEGNHGLSEEAFDAFNMATVEMGNAIVDIPARNADDMLRKIMDYSINGDHPDLHGTEQASRIWAEMRAMVA
ncbi:hypothetical protein PE067_08785 [Paracoccus sp. DMF-8]|uniref:hypothetical protein n=1 Tax=Paracoccus sp. DMF-8 TaxID=3019445 RepID=UPI0023E75932|nr:hypothetical protein [Paracoccus sp. DMF-8]MDF3606219.1 hypothetical protein [Paracoccus sp. DMF-8]